MKKRLLSLVLAASMILGSVNVAFADEASVPVDAEVVSEAAEDTDAETVITDDVESEASVEADVKDAKAEATGPNWSTTSPWEATVYGDAGGQSRIDNLGNPDWSEYVKVNGETVYTYDVAEDGKNVNLRMGVPNPDDSSNPYDGQGKIASNTEGRVMYYRVLDADDDFTLTATAHVNGIDIGSSNANQVSFGAAVIDDITPGINQKNTPADSVNAGVRQMKNGSDNIKSMNYGFIRSNGTVKGFTPDDDTELTIPAVGDDIKIKLKKSGTSYTVQYGTEKFTFDANDNDYNVTMEGDIYVGLYVAKCADITFKNVNLYVVGEPVEVGPWTTDGNGLNAQSAKQGTTTCNVTQDADGKDEKIELSVTDNVGKFDDKNNEYSYSYRAMQAPGGVDFKVESTIDSMSLNADNAPKQAAAGFIVFNDNYIKNDTREGFRTAQSGNFFFVGIVSSNGTSCQLVYKYRKGDDDVVTEPLMSSDICTYGVNTDPMDISIRKSGDIIKIKAGDNEAVDVPIPEDLFEDNQYIGYAVARNGHINVSNNKVEVGTKKVKSLEIISMPEKLNYYSTEKFDSTGLVLEATYVDGEVETITNPDSYSLTGFDAGRYFTTPGNRTVYVSMGSVSKEIPVNVRARKVTNLSIDYAPVYDTYYSGGKLNTVGLQITATYEDGTTKKLTSSEYVLTIGDTVIEPNSTTLTSDMVGEDVAVMVKHSDADITIDPNNINNAFYITIEPGNLTGIKIYTRNYKTTYYVGDELDTTGLTIYGIYTDEKGTVNRQYITNDKYEIVGFDSSKAVDSQTLTVRLKENTSLTDSYTIKVLDPAPVKVKVNSYPRLTYSVDEEFDTSGMEFAVLYTNNTSTILCEDVYFYKNGTEYFKKYNKDIDGHSKDEVVSSTEEEVLAADFYIDLTDFDNTTAGTTKVVLHVNSKYGVAAQNPVEWSVTIADKSEYVWKATLFGASSLGAKEGEDSSYITANYKNGTSALTTDGTSGIQPELMEDGVLSNIDSVNVVSWGGAGKISGDQDGIAYYYTNVNAQNNFTVSADITVNGYIRDPDNLGDVKSSYDKYYAEAIAEGYSESMANMIALDKSRSGQEAFGIMARDIVPFAGGLDSEGNYLGGATNMMTPFADNAIKQSYEFTKNNGDTVTYESPVDLLDAKNNGITVTDKDGVTYSVTKKNVEAQISSNIVIAGGCTDGTYPTDPTSSSYYRKSIMNRINIMTRRGVVGTSSGGERVGIYSTTDKVPEKGEKYNITLTKMNTGYMITTYDYQTQQTVTKYSFESEDDTENVLEIQDDKNIYVGFFASRFADITVENIELHETNPDTDPIITGIVDEAVAPKVTVSSPYYTTVTNYSLRMKSNSTKGMTGGITNISMNGKTVYKDVPLGNKIESFDVNLVPDSVNRFSVVYYPNTADNFTSYDPVITRFTVTHKTMSDVSKIYVGPNGSVSGDGSRENPINLETALGLVGFGGEVIMLDGTYNVTNRDSLDIEMPSTYSGYDGGNFKTLRAEEGATPIIDLEKEFAGFNVDADYWYFKGITICNSKDNEKAFGLAGMHCVVEDCTFYDNGTTGFQISRINSSDANILTWPSYNVVKSCESFNNCDPSKNNADGFAAKLTVGYGNVFEDCISHHNLDDGWDCYTKINSGAIGAVVLENCISYKQGYQLLEDGKETDFNATSGGNGYKLGGEGIYVKHYLKDCLVFSNKASGVDTNNNPALKIRNLVAYNNLGYNLSLYSNTADSLVDAEGKSRDEDGRVYKFDYDIKGAVSAGTSVDQLSSVNNEVIYGNVSSTPILDESNYLKVCPEGVFLETSEAKKVLNKSDYTSMDSANGYVRTEDKEKTVTLSDGIKKEKFTYANYENQGDVWDEAKDFKSIDPTVSMVDQRYQRAEDGSFIHGDFLARTVPYTHEAEDIVTLPDVYGGNGGVGLGITTSETTTETTTKAVTKGSSGAGGGGSVSQYKPKTTTTETTTVVEDNTETTTKDLVLTDSISVKVGDKNITINEDSYAMDVAPYIQADSNSTMVPLRFVAIAIAGGNVENADSSNIITWDAVTKTATIAAGSKSVVFTAGAGTYTVNGNTLNISNQAVAEIVDGRMFVPFRTIGEALGADVSWDADTKTAMYN